MDFFIYFLFHCYLRRILLMENISSLFTSAITDENILALLLYEIINRIFSISVFVIIYKFSGSNCCTSIF